MTLLYLFLLTLVGIPDIADFEYEILSDWELKRITGDIEFSYRQVRVGDTMDTKEMRMRFPIDAAPSGIVPYFQDADLFMEWSPNVDECKIVNTEGAEWTMYKHYGMPWPIAERDIITTCHLTVTDTLTHLRIIGIEDGVPLRKGVKRITRYEGQWFIWPDGAGSSRIEFRTVQLNRPVGPRGLQNSLVEKSFIKSIELLRELTKSP